ncbi:hypothetical protein [Corallococcus sp. CA049B]|uniref:hypothetical protein n=1 Tax=Corallococcus sp. CA049B TaxID=2316730 RepID=UPI0018F68B84|nr:hypothetical protein [Corallococcus sp. CA049B]
MMLRPEEKKPAGPKKSTPEEKLRRRLEADVPQAAEATVADAVEPDDGIGLQHQHLVRLSVVVHGEEGVPRALRTLPFLDGHPAMTGSSTMLRGWPCSLWKNVASRGSLDSATISYGCMATD